MEKTLSLTQEEATALLEMSLFTYLDNIDDATDSVLGKLGDLCKEFAAEGDEPAELCAAESGFNRSTASSR